ncbi:MAG: hypothetical protein OTJ44_09405 [Planctomycetota bacterium]|nr:hypothetical protein [Planctomycetota bacterium]
MTRIPLILGFLALLPASALAQNFEDFDWAKNAGNGEFHFPS